MKVKLLMLFVFNKHKASITLILVRLLMTRRGSCMAEIIGNTLSTLRVRWYIQQNLDASYVFAALLLKGRAAFCPALLMN